MKALNRKRTPRTALTGVVAGLGEGSADVPEAPTAFGRRLQSQRLAESWPDGRHQGAERVVGVLADRLPVESTSDKDDSSRAPVDAVGDDVSGCSPRRGHGGDRGGCCVLASESDLAAVGRPGRI